VLLRRTLGALGIAFAVARPAQAEPDERHDLTDAEWHPGASEVAPASEDVPPRSDPSALSPARRAAHVAAAVGPGAVVHGAGHVAAGRTATAEKLALAQGVGLGGMVFGLGGLALTGASRYLVAPFALTTIAGGALFFLPWAADVYGTATHPDGSGHAPTFAPLLVSELGHRYVYDPQFRYRHFLVQGADLRLGRLRVAARGWFALDDENARVRLLVGHRLSGPTPTSRAPDGSFVDVEAAFTHHRFDSDGFRVVTGEVALAGRRDLARLDANLTGAFVEGGAGLALQRFEYRIPSMTLPADHEDLLLARFGFGFYLGSGERWGEALLFYDHRHDDYAAGLKVPGLGSGVAGHLGAEARWFFGALGVRGEVQAGSAWLGGVSLLVREPPH
jgi:hypothetical protein